MVEQKYAPPLLVLRHLCEVRLSTGIRPVCDLLTQQTQWLPEPVSTAEGLEMVGLSFLGPFMSPSVFPEEDPGVAEKYFKVTIFLLSFFHLSIFLILFLFSNARFLVL